MSGFKKRFGFGRSNTSGEVVKTELPNIDYEVKETRRGSTIVGGYGDGNEIIQDEVRKMSEVEANRRLSTFRREHNFDPNLPDAAFEAIDEATEAHDHKGEAELVGEIVENSPYPEVRAVVRNYDEDVPVS